MRNKWVVVLGVLSLISLAHAALAQGQITGLQVDKTKDAVSVRIVGEDLSTPKEVWIVAGRQVAFEFDATLALKTKRFNIQHAGVTVVLAHWLSNKPPKVRLTFWLRKDLQTAIDTHQDGFTIRLGESAGPNRNFSNKKNWENDPAWTAGPLEPTKPSQKDLPGIKNGQQTPKNESETPAPTKKETFGPAASKSSPLDDERDLPPPLEPANKILEAMRANKKKEEEPLPDALKKPDLLKPKKEEAKPVQDTTSQTQPKQASKVEKESTSGSSNQVVVMNSITTHSDAPQGSAPGTMASGKNSAKPNAKFKSEKETPEPQQQQVFVSHFQGKKLVSLSFQNTDVALVLRALAMQSGVNIVMSLEVSSGTSGGTVSSSSPVQPSGGVGQPAPNSGIRVSLDLNNVSVEEALDFITSAAGLRYEKIGNTYVVTTRERYAETMRQLSKRLDATSEIRVVPIKSRAAGQIRDAVKLWFGPSLDVVLPSDSHRGVDPKSAELLDIYIFLAGSKRLVDDGEKLVRKLDDDIALTRNIAQKVEQDAAQHKMAIEHSQKVRVEESITTEVYDVKFSDPRSLREELLVGVPGLVVNIPPASAGNPRLYTEGTALSQAQQKTSEAAGSGTAAQPASSGGAPAQTAAVAGDTGLGQGLGQPFKEFEKTAVPMRLILRGSDIQIDKAKALLKLIDVAPKQVALELRVVELSREDALRTGIDWNLLTGGAVKLIRLNNAQTTPAPNNTVGVAISGKDIRGDVAATLDKSIDQSRFIARPNFVALDGRETEVFIGDVVRYVKSIINTQNGITVITDELRVGVRIAVLPRVGGEGNITMDLRPVTSTLRGFSPVPGGGQLPQTSERIAQSTISMLSGETVAIGGLVQDQDIVGNSGIPILMDLPLIGRLFRRSTNTKRRTEVVFFLTARAIDGPLRADRDKLSIEEAMSLGKDKKAKK